MKAPLPPPTNPTLRGLLDIIFLLESRQSRQIGAAEQARVLQTSSRAQMSAESRRGDRAEKLPGRAERVCEIKCAVGRSDVGINGSPTGQIGGCLEDAGAIGSRGQAQLKRAGRSEEHTSELQS